jgi:hypothetical protein
MDSQKIHHGKLLNGRAICLFVGAGMLVSCSNMAPTSATVNPTLEHIVCTFPFDWHSTPGVIQTPIFPFATLRFDLDPQGRTIGNLNQDAQLWFGGNFTQGVADDLITINSNPFPVPYVPGVASDYFKFQISRLTGQLYFVSYKGLYGGVSAMQVVHSYSGLCAIDQNKF